jgi:hypothetical protein
MQNVKLKTRALNAFNKMFTFIRILSLFSLFDLIYYGYINKIRPSAKKSKLKGADPEKLGHEWGQIR